MRIIYLHQYFKLPDESGGTRSYDLASGFLNLGHQIEIVTSTSNPKYNILGEPQMSKRGMYPTLSKKNSKTIVRKYMDFLQYADGKNSLLKISKYIKLDIKEVKKIYKILLKKKLLVC